LRAQCFAFRQLERRFFGRGEIVAQAKVRQVLNLIFTPSVPLCQSGV